MKMEATYGYKVNRVIKVTSIWNDFANQYVRIYGASDLETLTLNGNNIYKLLGHYNDQGGLRLQLEDINGGTKSIRVLDSNKFGLAKFDDQEAAKAEFRNLGAETMNQYNEQRKARRN